MSEIASAKVVHRTPANATRIIAGTVPVPPPLLRGLWAALVAGVVMLAVTTIQGALREGFDPWHQAVSALCLGPHGWVQTINLVAFGATVLAASASWRRVLAGGRGEKSYPLLNAVVGASFVAVGIIRQDPLPGYDPDGAALLVPTVHGTAHLAIAAIASLSSVAGFLVMRGRFAGDPAWRKWTTYSIAAVVAVVGSIAVFAVWCARPTGFAGTFERLAMVVPMVWLFAFLLRLRSGVPFMIPMQENRNVG